MALSIGFRDSVSFLPAIQATGLLTFTLVGLSPTEHTSLRWTYTEVPSLCRSYPASSVLRTSPPPHTARPVSRELPVDPNCDHRWGFPCCVWSPLRTCRRHYPGRFDGAFRSSLSIDGGLPHETVGSAPAIVFSRPAQRSLTLRPACSPSRLSDPLHRRLRQLRCLRCRFDCYRVERTSSRAGVAPAEVQRLSRRTVSPTRRRRSTRPYGRGLLCTEFSSDAAVRVAALA